jgi:tRNA(Phe) wybutosine-synthesizing methylase Tyw3
MAMSSQGQGQEGGAQPWRHAGGSVLPWSVSKIAAHRMRQGYYEARQHKEDGRLIVELRTSGDVPAELQDSGRLMYFLGYAPDMIAWLLGALAEAETEQQQLQKALGDAQAANERLRQALNVARANIRTKKG